MAWSNYCILYRSCHTRCSTKIGVLKPFANFTRKYLCWSHFFNFGETKSTLVLQKHPSKSGFETTTNFNHEQYRKSTELSKYELVKI